MKKIAIFASGSGTNAENICHYFQAKTELSIELILTNNPEAGVILRARRLHIPTLIFDKHSFMNTNKIQKLLQKQEIDYIVLAGFLWLVPPSLVRTFPNRIINIHPALLPQYGGKGMWGHHVHEAVVKNKETESGISIHYVNEHYDEGAIIFQAKFRVEANDTPEDVAHKTHELEYEHFPKIIEKIIFD